MFKKYTQVRLSDVGIAKYGSSHKNAIMMIVDTHMDFMTEKREYQVEGDDFLLWCSEDEIEELTIKESLVHSIPELLERVEKRGIVTCSTLHDGKYSFTHTFRRNGKHWNMFDHVHNKWYRLSVSELYRHAVGDLQITLETLIDLEEIWYKAEKAESFRLIQNAIVLYYIKREKEPKYHVTFLKKRDAQFLIDRKETSGMLYTPIYKVNSRYPYKPSNNSRTAISWKLESTRLRFIEVTA
jgi:hypothetical protein